MTETQWLAWKAGRSAQRAGLKMADNPFIGREISLCEAWEEGFKSARAEKAAKAAPSEGEFH